MMKHLAMLTLVVCGARFAPAATPGEYLDVSERLARFLVQYQDDTGAIIDPLEAREFQYATSYFVYGVAALVHAGRVPDLMPALVSAMDHATEDFAGGNRAIPDQHGEFYLASLADALVLLEEIGPERLGVDMERLTAWRTRLETPLLKVIASPDKKINNWRTYAMKGAWALHRAGLMERQEAVDFIEDAWRNRTQAARFAGGFYRDWNGDPQSHAVEAVGRVNLLALVMQGYDGPSAESIRRNAVAGTRRSLLYQDPTGQCPPNGRTDNHVFNDILYGLGFALLAQDDPRGEFRKATDLAFESVHRWWREDAPWQGMLSITKNHLPPEDRVGYQNASQVTNYTGANLYHLMETYHVLQAVTVAPAARIEKAPVDIAPDDFGSAVINVGDLQIFINLRGDTVPKYGKYWTPLGVARISRAGWDSRLGPSDGAVDDRGRLGVSLAPTWREGTKWTHLAEQAQHYRGTVETFVETDTLVRCSVLYSPVTGVGGPSFYLDLVVTPVGVLAGVYSPDLRRYGLTLPLLVDDGRPQKWRANESGAHVHGREGYWNKSSQHFLPLNDDGKFEAEEQTVLSAYGVLQPVVYTSRKAPPRVFIYPRSEGDPEAETFAESVELNPGGPYPAEYTALRDRPVLDTFSCLLGDTTWDRFIRSEVTVAQP